MKGDTASRTARSVAAHRLDCERVPAPYEDPDADEALARDVIRRLRPASASAWPGSVLAISVSTGADGEARERFRRHVAAVGETPGHPVTGERPVTGESLLSVRPDGRAPG